MRADEFYTMLILEEERDQLEREPTAVTKSSTEETLRRRVAELERTIGRQSVEIDFFKGVFKRLEAQPKAPRRGGAASTRRSGE